MEHKISLEDYEFNLIKYALLLVCNTNKIEINKCIVDDLNKIKNKIEIA